MARKRKELSHEEIWDDAGLIQSWDEAYEEYKRYHSIAARGERIEDVLAATSSEMDNPPHDASQQGEQVDVPERNHDRDRNEDSLDDGEVEEGQILSDGANEVRGDGTQHHVDPTQAGTDTGLATVHATAGSSSDPALKNLMMSWYWAGYYTGFYEGQRQAITSNSQPS